MKKNIIFNINECHAYIINKDPVLFDGMKVKHPKLYLLYYNLDLYIQNYRKNDKIAVYYKNLRV